MNNVGEKGQVRFHNTTLFITQEKIVHLAKSKKKKRKKEEEVLTYHVNIYQSYEQNDKSIITQ